MANSIVSTIIGYGMQAAKIGSDTRISGLDTTSGGALNRIVDRENRNFILAPDQVNQPGWDFMIDEYGYELQSPTTTTGALVAGSTTVPVTDLAVFAAAVTATFTTTGGAAAIYTNNIADPFLFGTASASTGAGNLTTATQVSFTHASGDSIYPLYQMPSAFRRPRAERNRGDGVSVNTIPYYYGGTGVPNGQNFSIFLDTSGSKSYIWVPRDLTGTMLVRYDKSPTSLTTTALNVDVPIDYEEYLVQKVAAHILRILSKDDKKIADAEMQAQMVLDRAFSRRSINKRVSLTRGPIRSPTSIADEHYMDSSGNIY